MNYLLQLDGSQPNLALMRLSAHFKERGEEVVFKHADSLESVHPFQFGREDKIYASALFSRTKPVIDQLKWGRPDAVIGGTGYDFSTTLESLGVTTAAVDYSIYPQTSEPARSFTIQPIPTYYNGYYFRSRLEARWAVFFDILDIRFEYEKEGYRLQDGTRYLPDFWFPRVCFWGEVKGTNLTPDEFGKCSMLARGSGNPCLLLTGAPTFTTYIGIDQSEFSDTTDYLLDIDFHKRHFYDREGRFYGCTGGEFCTSDFFSVPYRVAVNSARAQRFERTNA